MSQNTRLQLLLARAPITDEDRHNISRIFGILSTERQIALLSDWDGYIARFISIRQDLEEQEAKRLLTGLQAISVLLDEAALRESEQQSKKQESRARIREELESTVAYEQMQQLRRIKDIAKTPV